jgi:hypothetical protein
MPAHRVSPSTTGIPRQSSVSSEQRPSQSESTNNSENCSENFSDSKASLVTTNTVTSSDNKLTPYQRVLHNLENDERWKRDLTLGRRVGFYRFRGDIGNGNFSNVKMAIHCLTKGDYFFCFNFSFMIIDILCIYRFHIKLYISLYIKNLMIIKIV